VLSNVNDFQNQDELELQKAEHLLEIQKLESRQSELEEAATKLETWYQGQTNNVFGKLQSFVESELARARGALDSSENASMPSIPDDSQPVDARKNFHKKIRSRGFFNGGVVSFFFLLPVLIDFIDSLGFLTLLGPGIYPIVGVSVFIAVVLFVIIRRARKGNQRWPGKRIALWIFLAVAVSVVVGAWPVSGLIAKIVMNSGFVPNGYLALVIGLGLWLLSFLNAMIKYFTEFEEYRIEVSSAHAALNEMQGGTLALRTDIRRLEVNLQQIRYWAEVLGLFFRKPWNVSNSGMGLDDWKNYGAIFPKSLRIGNAVEVDASGLDKPSEIKKLEDSVVADSTKKGWRLDDFNSLIRNSLRAPGNSATLTLDGLYLDSPASPNGYREKLLELVKSEKYLDILGGLKILEALPNVQDKILESADLQVAPYAPADGQNHLLKWDEHLMLAVGDLEIGARPLARFAIRDAHQPEGYNHDVAAFIAAPERLMNKMRQSKSANHSSVTLIPSSAQTERNIDLVLRLEICGLAQVIPASAVILPDFEESRELQ
jgi:hypothetical protein